MPQKSHFLPMAIGSTNTNSYVLHLLVSLLFTVLLPVVFCQDNAKPTISIRPNTLKLPTINATIDSRVAVQCSTSAGDASKINSIKVFSISRTLDHPPTKELKEEHEVIVSTETSKEAELTSAVRTSGKYEKDGRIGHITASTITFIISPGRAECEDGGVFKCKLKYDPKPPKADGKPVDTEVEGRLDIAPMEFQVSRTPSNDDIKVGMKLNLTCTAVIGTIKFGPMPKSRLIWMYTNRETSIANQYNLLEKELESTMKTLSIENLTCSERQTVQLDLTVNKIRDSLRDYYCVVQRHLSPSEITYVSGKNNKISMPSYEEPAESGIGVGGYVGIALGVLAFLAGLAFVIVWMVRRKKKRSARKEELKKRKAEIDDRRKSIASIVERRKSLTQGEEESEIQSETSSTAQEDTSAMESEEQ